MKMEWLFGIGIFIGLLIGGSGGALGMSIWKDNWFSTLPPKVFRQEITQETTVAMTAKNELKSYQIQQTSVYNDAEAALILSFTNQTAYSNLLESLITNSNTTKTTTNTTTNVLE